jgi:hypothetical protein
VVFDGQSLVLAPGWDGTLLGWSWPRLAMTNYLGVPATTKCAIGGTSLTSLATTFADRAAPFIARPSYEPTVYVLCGGHTDYASEHDSGAQVYSDSGALATLARAAGAQYVICTTTFPSTAIVDADEASRQAGNALILADGSGHFDATIDFEVPGLDDPRDGRSYFDGVHLYGSWATPSFGTARAATVARSALDAAIATVT